MNYKNYKVIIVPGDKRYLKVITLHLLNIYLFIYLCIYLPIYLFIFIHSFIHLPLMILLQKVLI